MAIGSAVNVVAALAGGALAASVAAVAGFAPDGPDAYRVLLVVMLVAGVLATITLLALHDDHPARRRRRTPEQRPGDGWTGEPIAARADLPPSRRTRLGLPRPADPALFAQLLLPGFLISLGAGQVIPFLNLFVRGKFGLNLAELNAVFALTSLGTTLAILLQPALASRVGKIGSVVIVQGASIPFLVVLGFSPVLWTVIGAMAIRNSLMNAGNPIFNAFAMEALRPADRATYSAAASLALVARLGDRRAVVQLPPEQPRVQRRLHRELRHDHRPLHDRHLPDLALVPPARGGRGPGRAGGVRLGVRPDRPPAHLD